MNVSAVAEEFGLTLSNQKFESVSSLLASRSKESAKALTPTAQEVFKGCREEIKSILLLMIAARTRDEHKRQFAEFFPKYMGLSLAISYFASAVVPQSVIERLSRESLCELEADFRDKGVAAFGTTVRSQALFTIWTLRRINEIVIKISATRLDESKKKEDIEACVHFIVTALRAKMALDCLRVGMDREIAVHPEVSEELMDDLRSMVNAYAWARKGLEIRIPSVEPELEAVPMDEEDQQLLETAFVNASELAEGL
jgi:hypothetical protein